MTERAVIIKSSEEKGPSTHGCEYIDTSPDREEYELEGVNCTPEEFMDWFFFTSQSEDFCCSGDCLIDIGGSSLNLKEGRILSVSYEEYFIGKLNSLVTNAHNQLRVEVLEMFDKLGIMHYQGEALCLMGEIERKRAAGYMKQRGMLSEREFEEMFTTEEPVDFDLEWISEIIEEDECFECS